MSIVNKIRDIFVPPEDEEFEDEMDILNSSAPESKKDYDYEEMTVSTKKNKVGQYPRNDTASGCFGKAGTL